MLRKHFEHYSHSTCTFVWLHKMCIIELYYWEERLKQQLTLVVFVTHLTIFQDKCERANFSSPYVCAARCTSAGKGVHAMKVVRRTPFCRLWTVADGLSAIYNHSVFTTEFASCKSDCHPTLWLGLEPPFGRTNRTVGHSDWAGHCSPHRAHW